MVFLFSWLAVIILFVEFVFWYTKRLDEYFSFALFLAALAVFFVVIDLQYNSLENYVYTTDLVKNEHEVCDMSAVHSDCNKTTTITFENTTQAQEYLAIKEAEKSANTLISSILTFIFLGGFFFILIDYLKRFGLIK